MLSVPSLPPEGGGGGQRPRAGHAARRQRARHRAGLVAVRPPRVHRLAQPAAARLGRCAAGGRGAASRRGRSGCRPRRPAWCAGPTATRLLLETDSSASARCWPACLARGVAGQGDPNDRSLIEGLPQALVREAQLKPRCPCRCGHGAATEAPSRTWLRTRRAACWRARARTARRACGTPTASSARMCSTGTSAPRSLVAWVSASGHALGYHEEGWVWANSLTCTHACFSRRPL